MTVQLHLKALTCLIASAFLYIIPANATTDLKTIIGDHIPWRTDGKIDIPRHIKHIKLDIGLSYSAPMSQQWLSHENDLVVFGFEPNPSSIASILGGAQKRDPRHGTPLEKKFIGHCFFLIPCALGLSDLTTVPFFVTADDCGCSSIYAPKTFAVEQIIEVPLFPLSAFFALFPFDTHPIIEYIKIDAQGSDLDIIKSGAPYIAEHVIFVTLEAEDNYYNGTHNSTAAIDAYMCSIGFMPYISPDTIDPTYINNRYVTYAKQHAIHIYQRS